MDRRRWLWTRRARTADRYWEAGIPLDEEDLARTPDVFRLTVERVGRPLLSRMAEDETVLRCLREGRIVDGEQLVNDVLVEVLPTLDPRTGVRMAIAKLQLALLEAIDRAFQDDVLDDFLDREWTDEKGLVGFFVAPLSALERLARLGRNAVRCVPPP